MFQKGLLLFIVFQFFTMNKSFGITPQGCYTLECMNEYEDKKDEEVKSSLLSPEENLKETIQLYNECSGKEIHWEKVLNEYNASYQDDIKAAKRASADYESLLRDCAID